MIRKYFYGLREISREQAGALDGEGVVVCNLFDCLDFENPIVVENDLTSLPRCAHKMHSYLIVGNKKYRLLEFPQNFDTVRYNKPYRNKIALVMDEKYRVCVLDIKTGKRLFGVDNKYRIEILNDQLFAVGGGNYWAIVNRAGKKLDEVKNGTYQLRKNYVLRIENGAQKNKFTKLWLQDLKNKQLG